MKLIDKKVFKAFIKESNKLLRSGKTIFIRSSLPTGKEAIWTFFDSDANQNVLWDVYPQNLQFLTQKFPSRAIDGYTLKKIVIEAFKASTDNKNIDTDDGFAALRSLSLQRKIGEVSSFSQNNNIQVSVCSSPIGSNNSTNNGYSHVYLVHIANIGTDPVQVLARHWVFTSGDGSERIEVPKYSPGVVGEQPIILPGQAFEYRSGVVIKYPKGTMEGTFLLANLTNSEQYEVPAGTCSLLPDGLLHS